MVQLETSRLAVDSTQRELVDVTDHKAAVQKLADLWCRHQMASCRPGPMPKSCPNPSACRCASKAFCETPSRVAQRLRMAMDVKGLWGNLLPQVCDAESDP